MNTKKYHFLKFSLKVLLFWMLCNFSAYSQNGVTAEQKMVFDQLAELLHSISKNNAPDLVYLQTSKSIYETEEDVWFKGYVLDAQYFIPSGNSKTLFVQLIEDKTDKAVWEKKYEIENNFVNGHLFLDNSLAEGTYTLAAYSSSSFTKDVKEFYALKKITIVKTITQKTALAPIPKDSTLLFTTFPEGGKLISRIKSTLAFKAVNPKGLPVDVSGTLFENDIPLLHFKSSHAGMGSFVFTPDISKKYHIELTEPASREKYSLPQIEHNGKVLQLKDSTNETLTFRVSQSIGLKEETVYLRLQVRGVVYMIAVGLLKNELTVKIPLKDVPQGIAEVTLFDGKAVPLAERLVYVNPGKKLYIKTELDKKDYGIREKVNLKIKVIDENGQPAEAHLGVSIYDGIYQNKQDSKNIESHYFLSTQLKGNIYDPAYYFNEQNIDRQEALNLLLLTQGWRSYVWEENNLRELGNIPRPIVFDELKAKVILKKTNLKGAQLQQGIILFSADEHKGTDLLVADETGTFSVISDHLKKGDGGYIYLRLMTTKPSHYRIELNDFSFEEINKERKIKTTLYPMPTVFENKAEVLPTFPDRPNINKLKEVLITKKKKKVFRDKYIGKLDSLARGSFTTDYVCFNNLLNCSNHKNDTSIKPVEGVIYDNMNGVPYRYPDSNLTEAQLLEMFNITMIKGYYGKKVFYEPIYDEVTITDPTPDYRNTLFWKPDIITNKQGEATVDFFCSDLNTIFLGNIEGVSGDGLIGAENFEFNVRKNKL